MISARNLLTGLVVAIALAHVAATVAQENTPADKPIRHMLVGHLGFPDEAHLQFAERIRPDIVVMGAFGAPQWAAQEDPRAWVEKWRGIFARLHQRNIKIVGMLELLNVGNTPQEAEKFIEFYEQRWDENLFGKHPAASGASLLERRSMPLEKQTGMNAPRGCANNPNWRAVEKALVAAMIDAGIDGFITHRNMFGQCGCPFCIADWGQASEAAERDHQRQHSHDRPAVIELACDHCRGGLRRWFADRYDKKQLQERFGITDLKTHRFAAIYGHHIDHEHVPMPVVLEAMKYARHAVKETFDDVLVKFARSKKPDLIVAQWDHMPYFDELHLDGGHIPVWKMTTFAHASADERWSLPLDLWGRGEDFYWYCNWGTCQNTQLDKRFLADATLYGKLLRSLARGKPYVINKYDFYRPRNMMAEAAALGMIAGAIQVPYRTPEDVEVMERYFNFLKEHAEIYANSNGQALSDVLVVYPRALTHAGDAEALEMIELAGRTLVIEHIQFDMVPDDLLGEIDLQKYRVVVAAETAGLIEKRFAQFRAGGGTLIGIPRTAEKALDPTWHKLGATVIEGMKPHSAGTEDARPVNRALLAALGDKHVRFRAPYTVEPHVYRQPGKIVIHLVNYNHTEKASGTSSVEREAPLAAGPVDVRLPLPEGVQVRRVTFLDPDRPAARTISFQQEDFVATLQTPEFLVYGVCVIETE